MIRIQQSDFKFNLPIDELLMKPARDSSEVLSREEFISEYTRNQMRALEGLFSAIPKCIKGGSRKKISSDHVYKAIVKRAGHGCAGFTFIFNMTPSAISGTFLKDVSQIDSAIAEKIESLNEFSFCRQNLKLILKWALKEDQIIQSLYNNIYRYCGFLSPYSLQIADKESHTVEKICNVAYENKLCISSTMSLTSTIGFKAANLDEARKGKFFDEYSLRDWDDFFLFLGKLTVLDMLLGNHDRILRYNPSSGELDLQWNYANIMVDPKTKQCLAIDNGIDGGLLPKEKVEEYSTEGLSFDEGEVVSPAVLIEKEVSPQIQENTNLFCINQYFDFFHAKAQTEGELEMLAEKVGRSFFKDDEMAHLNCDEIALICIRAWRTGILEMLKNIKENPEDFKKVVTIFFQSKPQGDVEFREKLLDVILKNINSISSI